MDHLLRGLLCSHLPEGCAPVLPRTWEPVYDTMLRTECSSVTEILDNLGGRQAELSVTQAILLLRPPGYYRSMPPCWILNYFFLKIALIF